MKARSLSLLLVLTSASLAGCLAGETATPADAGASETTDAGPLTTAPSSPNQAPVVDMKILVNGTQAQILNDSYPVPAGEAVTFDASASMDPEGLNLTFAWDFGGNGSASEAIANHTFAQAGNYTVTLTVTDEDGLSSEAVLNLSVEASGPAPGTPLTPVKKVFTGTYTAGIQGTSCVANTQGVGHTYTHVVSVPATEMDAPLMVNKWKIVLTGGTTSVDQAFRFVGPDGKTIKDVDAAPTGNNGETLTVEGSFPPGDYKVTVYGCVAASGTYKLDVEGTTVAA